MQAPAQETIPHYLSKTSYHADRLFRVLYALSLLISVAYVAIRVVYIATGRVNIRPPEDANDRELANVERQNRVAVVYSIIVLVAEIGGIVLIHAGQQMFTRQRTLFAEVTPSNVQRLSEARHCLVATARG